MRRAIGFVMLLVGLLGVVVGAGGVIASQRALDSIAEGLDDTLRLSSDSLDTVNETLLLTKSTLSEANGSLHTVSQTAGNVSQAITETRPFLDQVTTIATADVPESLEAVQESIPSLVEIAGAIDLSMRALSAFQSSQRILGIPIRIDLGVDYDPELPFDQAVTQIGDSIEELPDSLRALEFNLGVANENLAQISSNVDTLAADLDAINIQLEEVDPLLDEYIRLVTRTNDLIRQSRANVTDQIRQAKLVLTVLFVWIALSQLAPLYLGWEIVRGDREREERIEN